MSVISNGAITAMATLAISMGDKIKRKAPGWEHLFEVPGERWEDQTESLKAMHVTCKGKHIVVYAYLRAHEFNVVTYLEGGYANEDCEQWMGPMEALCVILEAQKEAGHAKEISVD